MYYQICNIGAGLLSTKIHEFPLYALLYGTYPLGMTPFVCENIQFNSIQILSTKSICGDFLENSLVLFILFESRDKTKASSRRDMCLKATHTKESRNTHFLHAPRVRCAQVIGGWRTPYKKRKKSTQVENG
jgi:hypothetical protein